MRPHLFFWKGKGGGGGGGGGGGQDRVRGRHLTAANTLSTSGRFNQCLGEGGGGGGCPLSADSINEVFALSADSTSGRWVLSAFSQFSQWGVRMYINFYYKGERPSPPPGTPMAYTDRESV